VISRALITTLLVLEGPLLTKLNPVSQLQFDAYSRQVRDAVASARPSILDSSSDLHDVMSGKVLVRAATPRNPVSVTDGLVHDWVGDVFIPHVKVKDVLAPLRDFDRHAHIYPDITRSRTLHKTPDEVQGYWRLERKSGVVTMALDVTDDVRYRSPAPGTWLCFAHTPKVIQVDDAGTSREHALPAGEGYGFLWSLDAYWILQERDGGVLAECRTVSLSRGVPAAVAWMVKPFVTSQPKAALQQTLEATRTAVEHPSGA
jgi:hypothetical protein